MSLKIHTVKRKVLAGEHAGKEMYFGQVRLNEEISLDKLSRQVAANTTATPADVEGVINGLLEVLVDELDDGSIVELGELGNMRMSAGSSGVEKPEDFHCRLMRRPRIVLTPGTPLKAALDATTYEWLRVKVNEVPEDCQQGHTI